MKSRWLLRDFFDALHDTGNIPITLGRWEMTGLGDEVRELSGSD